MKRIGEWLNAIFGIGILLSLFAGGLSFVGYIVAMIGGGDFAVELCAFIFKSYLPWVIKITSIVTGIGLLGMYLNHKKALTISSGKK